MAITMIEFGQNFQEMIISLLLGKLWNILIIFAKSSQGMPQINPNFFDRHFQGSNFNFLFCCSKKILAI